MKFIKGMTRKDRGKEIMEDKIVMEGIIVGIIVDIMKGEGVGVEVEAEAGIEEVDREVEVGIIKIIIIIKFYSKIYKKII